MSCESTKGYASTIQQEQAYRIESPYNFLHDFVSHAQSAEKRIWAQTMYFENDHAFGSIAQQLKNGAKKGLDVRFITDHFAFMVTDGHINWIPSLDKVQAKHLRQKQQSKLVGIDELRESGVNVALVNTPNIVENILPIKGRSHIKMVVIDDKAWIGGLNFSDKDFNRPDTMMRINDPDVAAAIARQFSSIHNSHEARSDQKILFSGETSLLVDSGSPGKSVILDEAVFAIEHAKESITLTTQFFPDRKLLSILSEAQKRGINTKVITSDPKYITEVLARVYSRKTEIFSHLKKTNIPVVFYPAWVHIKALIADIGTEDATAIYGTHNFSEFGVRLGTEEVAIISKDPKIVTEVNEAIRMLEL